MNKLTTILLIFIVIGLFTTAFMLNEIRTELQNEPAVVANNTTNGTVNATNETGNTTLINSTEYESEETVTEPVEDESTAHEMYESQFNPKDGEPKGQTLKEEYIESTGASNGEELQEYMESHVPDDYK